MNFAQNGPVARLAGIALVASLAFGTVPAIAATPPPPIPTSEVDSPAELAAPVRASVSHFGDRIHKVTYSTTAFALTAVDGLQLLQVMVTVETGKDSSRLEVAMAGYLRPGRDKDAVVRLSLFDGDREVLRIETGQWSADEGRHETFRWKGRDPRGRAFWSETAALSLALRARVEVADD